MKKIVFLIAFLFQPASYADILLSPEALGQIDADLAENGKATVIVGLTDPDSASTIPDSTIKCIKNRFLNSPAMIESITSRSMQVIDELENLPHVLISVDSNGFEALRNHPDVVSIEADMPIKLQ